MLNLKFNISKIWRNNLKKLKVKLEKWLTLKNKMKKKNKIKNLKLLTMMVVQNQVKKYLRVRKSSSNQKRKLSKKRKIGKGRKLLGWKRLKLKTRNQKKKVWLSRVCLELTSQMTSKLKSQNIIKVNQDNWLLKLNLSPIKLSKAKRKIYKLSFKKKKMKRPSLPLRKTNLMLRKRKKLMHLHL